MKKLLFSIILLIGSQQSFAQEFIKEIKTYMNSELKGDINALLSNNVNTHISFKVAEKKAFAIVYQQLTQQGFKLAEDSVHQSGFEFKVLKNSSYQHLQFLSFDFYNTDKLYKGWASINIERYLSVRPFLGYTTRITSVVFPRDNTNIPSAFANMQVYGIQFNFLDENKLSDAEMQALYVPGNSFLKKICKAVTQTCTIACPSATSVPACPVRSLDIVSEKYLLLDPNLKYGNTSAASVSLIYNLFKDRTCLYIKTALANFYPTSIQ